jgi:hypothetical protein
MKSELYVPHWPPLVLAILKAALAITTGATFFIIVWSLFGK